MRDWIRAACEITIYAAERILEVLDARRPLHDEPLPAGHTDHWPDDREPIRPVRGVLAFDTRPHDRSGAHLPDGTMLPTIAPEYHAAHDHLMRRATTQWGNRPADPRMN